MVQCCLGKRITEIHCSDQKLRSKLVDRISVYCTIGEYGTADDQQINVVVTFSFYGNHQTLNQVCLKLQVNGN